MSGSPKVRKEDKVELWKLLGDGKWHKAKDLVDWNRVGWTNTRIIRAICEAEPHRFISTQAGYKRLDLATDAEIANAINDLRSRAKKLNARAEAIDAALYDRQFPQQARLVK